MMIYGNYPLNSPQDYLTKGGFTMKNKKEALGASKQQVDAFMARAGKWKEEFEKLRKIILGTGLDEELKWGQLCYSYKGKNIVLIHGFKEYCAMLFFKGSLLKDPKHILIQQTENVQAARQARFTSVQEVDKAASILKAYIKEAIEVEKSGREVKLKKTEDYAMPEELKEKLDENPALKTAFNSLTPGRQRGYIFYFSQAKQSETRKARIEKYTKQILKGRGFND